MTLPAGAELDLVVAKAIGIDVLSPEAAIAAVRSSDRDVYCYGKDPVYGECVIRIRDGYAVWRLPWSPSSNITHAFEVLERLVDQDWVVDLTASGFGYRAEMKHKPENGLGGTYVFNEPVDTMSMAICLIALKGAESLAALHAVEKGL